MGAAVLLSGCSMLQTFGMSKVDVPPRDASHKHASHKHASHKRTQHAATPTPTSTPTQVSTRLVRGSLAAGSVTHDLPMGARRLVVTYWTNQAVATWTASAAVPVQLSAHVENSSTKNEVLVTRAFATFDSDATPDVTILRDDQGRFTATPPFSYDSAVIIPGVSGRARTAHLRLEFDLLIETHHDSGLYVRQTVLDQLTFTYATAPLGQIP